jgi:hypothetical protein
MTWFVSFIVALISGAAGLFLAGFIANACVTWYSISSREGASGFFVVFVALGGGVLGLVLGLISARLVASGFGPSFAKELLGSVSVVLLIAGVAALFCRMLADVPPKLAGSELNLEVEFRFPNTYGPERSPVEEGDWLFSFASVSGKTRRAYREGMVQRSSARYEDGQWIVLGRTDLFTERGKRLVTLSLREATEVMSFLLPLPPRPTADFEKWSDWLPRQQANGQPWPTDKMSCRFRIQKILASSEQP